MASRSRARAEWTLHGAVARWRAGWRARRRVTLVALLLILHLAPHGLWRVLRLRSPWPRSFLKCASRAAGIDVHIRGEPRRHDVLFAANHLTWFDITVLAGVTGARFIAKAEIAGWPLIGFLAGLNRTVYVSRAARGRVAEQAGALRAALAEHDPVALFPEGGTGDGIALKPFRAALLAALLPPLPGVLLQPVAIDYGDEARTVAWTSRLGFGGEMMRLLGLPGRRRVTLDFLAPLDPVALPDRKLLTAAARDRIAAALGVGGAPAL